MKKISDRVQLEAPAPLPEQWRSFAWALETYGTDKSTGQRMSPAYMAEQVKAGFDPLRYNLSNSNKGILLKHILSNTSGVASTYFDALLPLLDLESVVLNEGDATDILKKSFEHGSFKISERLLAAGLAGYRPTVLTDAKDQAQFDAVLDNLGATGVVRNMDHLMSALLAQHNTERTKAFLARNLPVEGLRPGSNAIENITANLLNMQNDSETIRVVTERYRLAEYIAQQGGLKTNSPLAMVRSRKDYREVMDLMLSLGMNVDGRDKNGMTGLMKEVELQQREDVDMVRHWIERGADIDAKGPDGKSVLHVAVKSNRIRAVDVLHDSGANMMVRDGQRLVAFWSTNAPAAYYCHHLLGRTIPFGRNLAMVAAMGYWPEKLREAFENGDDPAHVTDGGETILEMVVRQDVRGAPAELFQIMEEFGVDMNVNFPVKNAKTNQMVMRHPLHFLLDHAEDSKTAGEKTLAYLALTKTVDVDCKDVDGLTPLYRAAKLGNRELFKAFLDAGADTGIRCGRLTLKAVAKDEKIKEMLFAATTEQNVGEMIDVAADVAQEQVAPAKARKVIAPL